ncbi:hypothetical protein AAFC00_005092 [Neodothiora populina]|uniref:Sacsin/Nov domain-containing protein n=1 Tax=Neodothiora populina TaxID=2781224 RepID=A0ABR3PK47_9PEZI
MAAPIDYARLREQTMGSGLDEEAVTVNTRALIDKVLARYSGEWTTLRELIQNAADASAKKVVIKFETLPSPTIPVPSTADPSAQLRHVLLSHTLSRLLVSNDGEAFGENDWSRLKRIAEGNPDETKIGAFGVGFYSVFADCENPFVGSGDQTMAFYWKGNSLFTRRGRLPQGTSTGETCFVLDYRNTTSPVPNLLSICRFLSTSLTFVGLEKIELWLDQWNLATLHKTMAPSANVDIPSDINPKTKAGLMKIVGVDYQNAQIHASWMNVIGWTRVADHAQSLQQAADAAPPTQSLRSFFSRLTGSTNATGAAAKTAARAEEAAQRAIAEDLAGTSEATVFLRISTVNLQTYCSKTLAAELERATKKPPPKHTKIAILTSSYHETSQTTVSGSGSSKAGDIFASVLPTKNGRIFIGFPTAQTSGLLAHISAPSVIPTVERENIDLNARWVRDWNVEMLRVAGIACRVAYNGEMLELKASLERQMTKSGTKKVTKQDLATILPAAVHTFKQYTYQESTPSPQVGQIVEEAFWTCNQKASVTIVSTRGVLPSNEVRIASEELSFVDGIPVVPDEIVDGNALFLNKLKDFGLLSDITTQDIKKELEARALDEAQLSELLKWAARKLANESLDVSAISTMFDGTVATVDQQENKTYPSPVLLLGAIDAFPNVTKIPIDLPVPPTTIPFRFIKGIPKNQLEAFGWTELQIVPWLRYLLEKDGSGLPSEQSFTTSVPFALQVLPVLSKGWDALSQPSKNTVSEMLSTRTVIPTKLGLRKPSQAYFSSVKLFDDLPTVQGLQGVKEKFLGAIGVRKTVELSVVFERLMAKSTNENGVAESKWSHVDLIKYLVSVREDIPVEDMSKLQKTPVCPVEKPGEVGKPNGGKLFRINELYEPNQSMRDLQLPLLHWPEPLRKSSPEHRFLILLGLRTYPEVIDMVAIMAKAATNGDAKMYDMALRYYITNFHTNGYRRFPMGSVSTPFLPIQGQPLTKLALPIECFANKRAAILGFNILREDLRDDAHLFGVEADPAIIVCADRLIRNPPKTKAEAKDMFGYFAGRLGEIGASGHLAEKLGESRIVPVLKRSPGDTVDKSDKVRLVTPRSCFLGDSNAYGDIFDFVDFGSEANSFLLKIGSKHEPSATELAGMLMREPGRLLNALGFEKYSSLLRRIADNIPALKADKTLWAGLQKSACLLAVKEISAPTNGKAAAADDEYNEYDEDASIKEYHLMTPADIIIVDDYTSFRLFRDKLTYAPQEEALEKFYVSLGAPYLSQVVEDDQRMGPLLPDQSGAKSLQRLLNERCRLFLHDHAPEAIRHDAKWLEKTLVIRMTSFLTLKKTLRHGYNLVHNEKRTAALHRETKRDATLYITQSPDMYEISRAIMTLLIKRPKQQDFLALEMIMESNLRRLKAKGYNVDRILRQKAAESRVAESERLKELEEQQKRAAEEERALQAQQGSLYPQLSQQNGLAQIPNRPIQTPDRTRAIPGAFETSPESVPTSAQEKRKTGFFSQFKETLGLNMVSDAQKHIKGLERNRDNYYKAQEQFIEDERKATEEAGGRPPPYTHQDATLPPPPPHPDHVEQVTPAPVLSQNLRSAAQASRAYDSTTLFDQPTTREIKETPTYCDTTPATNLRLWAESSAGVKVYLDDSIATVERDALVNAHKSAINVFAYLLLDISSIYDLRPQSLHIFYNTSGSSIAFNKGGAIFCNLRYFLQLHMPNWNDHRDDAKGKCAALVYWFVTVAHELAHNIEQTHNSAHGFYTESFIGEFWFEVSKKCGIWVQEAREAAASAAGQQQGQRSLMD